jgi:pyruvate ferredoxin oxidoreductase gamma subunit/2-oxoisovalerate ferredoxin oxidoreductase gamma subunit
MKEIKIHGRGGQGAVTAAQILATAAFNQGYWAQTFPQFGAERRGAPVVAFVRMDREPIPFRSKVYSPDVAIIMDFNLFKMGDPLADIKPGGTAIINFPDDGSPLPADIKKMVGQVFTVDASDLSHQLYGKMAIPITNTIILGAYCATDPAISLESIHRALPDFFPEDKIELNVKAVDLGKKHVREAS